MFLFPAAGCQAAVTVHGKLYSWGASACGQLGHCHLDGPLRGGLDGGEG